MRHLIRRTRVLMSVFYALMMEYRAELYLWALAGVLPLIIMGVWREAAAQGQFPMNASEVTRYFLSVFIVRQLTVVWVIWEFEHEVVQGKLSPYLLQPMDPAWRYLLQHISERFARLPFVAVLIAFCFLLYPDALWTPRWDHLLLGLLAVVGGFALRFTSQYTFAMLAFWIERAHAIEQLWYLPYLFLSGLIAPLAMFPETLRQILYLTPFPYLFDFPARLLIGQEISNAPAIWQSFLIMGVWIVAFFLLNRFLWRRGLRQYSAMGA